MKRKYIFSIFFYLLIVSVLSDDNQPEEKDPWDKSTDKYLQKDKGEDDMKVDVTEETDSEVHTEKSNVPNPDSIKADIESPLSEEVDRETKEQFEDAVDETDPADDIQPVEKKPKKTKSKKKPRKKVKHSKGKKKHHLTKKQFNYHGDFYPGSLWEYPYPYYHPQYGCGAPIDCPGKAEAPPEEAKEDEEDEKPPAPIKPPKKKQLVPTHYYGPPSAGWGGFQPGHTGGGWGAPYWYKKRSHTHRQLVPTHYYGPPSAGWGGFQPGHTGGGWGAPYWYKKRSHTHRQLVPTHYYGPPSAGWGGFQPGHTGGGWGAPYWYKKRSHTHRQLVPTHYYGPPSAGWGGFQPGHTGGGWGAPYWYKKRMHTHRQLVPTHYYGPPSAGWGGFQPGHTGGGWGAPYWYKSIVIKPNTRRGSKKFFVTGNDQHGLGFSGNDGWDSGFGNGYGFSWGQPNVYGWGPYAHVVGGPNDIDYKAWHGPDSFGTKGWGSHGWVGSYGWKHGDEQEKGFGSGSAGWGNAGGDMGHLDEKIGEGDFYDHGEILPHGGNGHLGHNSFFQQIGYNLAQGTHGSKSNVPIHNRPMKNNNSHEQKQQAERSNTREKHLNLSKNEKHLSQKKTVKTRAENEQPVTQ